MIRRIRECCIFRRHTLSTLIPVLVRSISVIMSKKDDVDLYDSVNI